MDGDGDPEREFREFVAARSRPLLRTAYLLTGDWAGAEDLLQTALTKTYLAWRRLGRIDAVEPYTRKVMVHTLTSWRRRRWTGEYPTEVLPEPTGPDGRAGSRDLDAWLDRDELWRHVQALPPRQRAVLVLRFYEDMTEAASADALGVSVGTIKSQTSKALAALRRAMSDDTATAVPDADGGPHGGSEPVPGPGGKGTGPDRRTWPIGGPEARDGAGAGAVVPWPLAGPGAGSPTTIRYGTPVPVPVPVPMQRARWEARHR